jgi:hypothetical protein
MYITQLRQPRRPSGGSQAAAPCADVDRAMASDVHLATEVRRRLNMASRNARPRTWSRACMTKSGASQHCGRGSEPE